MEESAVGLLPIVESEYDLDGDMLAQMMYCTINCQSYTAFLLFSEIDKNNN